MSTLVWVETNVQDVIGRLRVKQSDLPNITTTAGREIARKIKVDLQATTKQWKHRPVFVSEIETNADGLQVLAGTDDPIWNMLDVGTAPHIILPKRPGGVLAFRAGPYAAKSVPGWIGSRPGGPSGPMVFRRYVLHPGTAPRRWVEVVAAKWHTEAVSILDSALRRWSY